MSFTAQQRDSVERLAAALRELRESIGACGASGLRVDLRFEYERPTSSGCGPIRDGFTMQVSSWLPSLGIKATCTSPAQAEIDVDRTGRTIEWHEDPSR